MKINIVVHPGLAHLDDFLSVCFLLNHFGSETEVRRREPTEDDLEDTHTVVVDCGGQHNPSLLNFDHHQFRRDHQPCCALSLVLQYLGLYDIATETSWLRFVEVFDSKGPIAAAELVGCEHEKLKQVRSPLEIGVLQLFEEMEIVTPVFAAMMAGIARRFSERWELTANRIMELPSLVEWHANRQVALVMVGAGNEPLVGLERYFELSEEKPILTVTRSSRNLGSWAIYRRTGFEDVVDLSTTPGCIFNHANGFLAVTEKMDFQDAVEIAVEMLDGVADFEVTNSAETAVSDSDKTNPSYTAGPTTANPIHGRPWKASSREGKRFLSGFSAVWGGPAGPVAIVSVNKQELEAAWKKLIRSEIDQSKIKAVEIHEA